MALKLAAQYKIATAIKEIAEAMKIDTELIDTSAALDWSAEALRQIAQQIKDNGGFVGKLPIHLCVEGEYNPQTGKPTITTPEEDIFYLVPTGDSLGDDQFKAWVYSEGRWESWESMSVEIPQSDWNQTNTAATDYIKNKPTIPAAQIQSDWNQTTTTSNDYIKNKPAINAGTGVSSIAEGSGTTATGNTSHAEGGHTTASGAQSHAEGSGTQATNDSSHAEGSGTTASGPSSHAEGSGTTASGPSSHAEGNGTTASGPSSHAEGLNTKASEMVSHAEGNSTTASGAMSHAEGFNTNASGMASHAEGMNTIASGSQQHVFGKFNIDDVSDATPPVALNTYVEIVGNGTKSNARSNARTLDWSGNEWLAGNLTAAGGSITIGSTTITEAQLQALLALLN